MEPKRQAPAAPIDEEMVALLRQIAAHLAALRPNMPPPEWLTIAEAAAALRLSRDSVERLIASGRLRAAQITGSNERGRRCRYRISRASIAEFLTAAARKPRPLRERRRSQEAGIDFIG